MSKRARRLAAGIFPLQVELLENRLLLSAATTTTLAASSNPSLLGEVIALTATVDASGGTPGGTITFEDGSNIIGTVNIDPGTEQAIGFTQSLGLGTHNISAIYSGAVGFAGSISNSVIETVDPATDESPASDAVTTTTLVASSNPVPFGQIFALTATVTSTTGNPTGNVSFFDGSTLIGTVSVNTTTQQAIGFSNALSVGTHSITATYDGATGFATSTSSPVSMVISGTAQTVSTTTTLISSSATTEAGQVIAFAATVSSANGTPGGTVTFMDGSTLIGTVSIDPTTQEFLAFTSSLAVGTHNITATYNGATGFLSSKSATLVETVNPVGADTTTALIVTPNPLLAGQTVAFVATVTTVGGTVGGTVTFDDGSNLIGTVAINTTTHQAIGFSNTLTAGTHAITATYNGSVGFEPSTSLTVNEVVNPVGTLTTTTLASSSTGVVSGQLIALTATVTSTGGTPAGNVTFMDGITPIGTVAINTSTHQAIGFISFATTGVHNITAVYVGAGGFATSTSAAVHENVNPDATITTLVPIANNVAAGQVVGFIATVTPEAPGGGATYSTVTFMDGSNLIGTVAVNPTTQKAIGYALALTPGIHTITATFNGDAAYSVSTSAPLSQNSVGIVTTTTITAATATAIMGQTATFTASVTGSGAALSGTVTFTSGATTIGTATLDNTGKATLSEYNLFTGTYNVTATYSGDNTHAVSASNGSTSYVVTAPTYTTSSDNLGMFTATAGTGAAVATGQLIFVDYTGYLASTGVEFDSSLNAGRTPLPVGVGEGGLINGFAEGIVGLQTGETRVLSIPAALGYGAAGSTNGPVTIPPNADLVFILRLISVNQPRLTVSTTAATPVQLMNSQAASVATGTDFGSETVGLTSTASSFTLGNADGAFHLMSTSNPIIQISGADPNDFIVTQPSSLLQVQNQDGSTSGGVFTIAFKPTATGTRTATIRIATTDTDAPVYTFTVTGVGA